VNTTDVVALLTENEVREIRIPSRVYQRIKKIHNRQSKETSEEAFIVAVLRKGVEAIERELG